MEVTELFRDRYDLIRRYDAFYDELTSILEKHSGKCDIDNDVFQSDILQSDSGINIKSLQQELKNRGYVYSEEEINLILYNLIANQQRVIRKDYWSKEPIYEFLDRYYWESSLQRNFYCLRDDCPTKKKIFAFMSDTHIGLNDVYNPKLIDNFYDYIISQGATRCFHLGDLFEGLRNVSDDQKDQEFYRQLELFMKEYPNPSEILTYLTNGNHDNPLIKEYFMNNNFLTNHDGRYITALKSGVFVIPENKGGISGWQTTTNNRDFHFNHRLFLSFMQENCHIQNVDDINGKMLFEDYHYDVLVSGHLHKGFIYSTTNTHHKDKLYLGIPSTSSLNLNSAVGYLVYMDEDGNNMEISVLGSDESSNIREIERIPWSFTEKNKQYKLQLH